MVETTTAPADLTAKDVSADRAAELRRLSRLADALDSAFRIPGTRIRFGWDGILGLLPGIGDAAALAPAAYLITRAYSLGVSKSVLLRMVGNTAADTVLGAIPFIGDIFDIGFKANRRNIALLIRELESGAPGQRTS